MLIHFFAILFLIVDCSLAIEVGVFHYLDDAGPLLGCV